MMLNFSANFGGIVGLCMGFSILSGFELIYFFTARLYTDKRRKRQNARGGNKNGKI